ncbi:PREDICTED: uncharacterized protein LOC106148937 [Chinchilla lanigera]|uniref:uncharacterized protein LOC106148937 n=1 Tax=Chinchilla lanigera TaxID=34839 RepID=UPI0006964124|nr:PREDICTED: uncharacterized protein LOC106148937 [Chinchilla lanigera]
MIAFVALLVKEAHKLTFGQKLLIVSSHSLQTLIRAPPDRWLSNARVMHYQALLLDPTTISFKETAALNPATLLPDDDPSQPLHDCKEIIDHLASLRPDLTDEPLIGAPCYFSDGSSYILQGKRVAGAAVTMDSQVLWEQALEPGTSAQRAELIALTTALKLAEVSPGSPTHPNLDPSAIQATASSVPHLHPGRPLNCATWGPSAHQKTPPRIS